MFLKLQNWRSVGGGILHYGGMLAVGAGAIATGQIWTIAAATVLMGGIMGFSLKKNKEIMEDGLVAHPKKHRFSPNLQRMVDDLFKASGLSADKAVVYDFKVKRSTEKKHAVMGKIFKDMLGKVAVTPNAAALNLGKPVIMISEPLLELLDDDEEKAVLAHEFTHAAAYHQHIGMPQKLLGSIARTSNNLAVLSQWIGGGVAGVTLSLAAASALNAAVRKFHPNGHLLEKKKDDTEFPFKIPGKDDMRDIYEAKKLKKATALASTAAVAGVTQFFNPLYLPVLLSAKSLNLTASFLEKSFSRNKEYQADRGAVVLGASPLAMITALRKMTVVQKRSLAEAWAPHEIPKANSLQRAWKEAFATHPAVPKRINRLVGIAKGMGYGEEAIDKAVNGPIRVPNTVQIPIEHIIGMSKAFVGNEAYKGFSNQNDMRLIDYSEQRYGSAPVPAVA